MSTRHPHRILYMDDEESCASMVVRRLRNAGYDVEWVQDGEEGLNRLASTSYDVVAVDHRMPRKNGLEVVQTLANQGLHPPIIMITGSGCERVAVEAMKLGVKDYVIKDVDGQYVSLLPSVLDQVLKEQALIHEKERIVQDLKTSEQRYRLMVDQSPDGIMVVSDGLVTFANAAACRLLSARKPDALMGKALCDLWPASTMLSDARLEFPQRQPELIETELTRVDGQTVDVELVIVPVIHEGKPSVQLIARDISRRKKAEEALRKMNEELERRVAERTRELRNLNLMLQEKIIELETFHDVTVGREHKMIALEKEIQGLKDEMAAMAPKRDAGAA